MVGGSNPLGPVFKIKMVEHILIPQHRKLNEEEMENILKKYNISRKQLPKIKINDSAILEFDPKKGDVIEIIRDSPTMGKSYFYRAVV